MLTAREAIASEIVLDNKYRWVLDRIVFLSLCSIPLIFKSKVYMNDAGLKECDTLSSREF